MKLLVVSHPCSNPVNQQLFAVLEERTGWDISIAAPSNWASEYGETRALERWPGFEGRLLPVPVWLSGHVPLHVYRSTFRRVFAETQPDAVYVHHEPYGAATAQVYAANRLLAGVPIGFFTWQNIEKRYPPPFRQLEQMVFRQSAFAISGSESARAVLRRKGYDGPAPIIPAGIDAEAYTDARRSDALRRELGATDDGDVLVGFMGRIVEEKGLGTLLDALARLREQPWRLVLVGTGDHEDALRAQAAQHGLADRLLFTGYVPHTEAPRYLAAFDVLALPSETQPNWKEQFGRVIVEAMACGTPVLGSDSGEIPHLIGATGGGLVFPEGDAAACAEPLARLLAEPALRRRLAEAGQQAVRARYTHEALAQRLAETIRQAVHRSPLSHA